MCERSRANVKVETRSTLHHCLYFIFARKLNLRAYACKNYATVEMYLNLTLLTEVALRRVKKYTRKGYARVRHVHTYNMLVNVTTYHHDFGLNTLPQSQGFVWPHGRSRLPNTKHVVPHPYTQSTWIKGRDGHRICKTTKGGEGVETAQMLRIPNHNLRVNTQKCPIICDKHVPYYYNHS